ncbi:MAG: hypothetical protein J6S72_04840, partial [Lachnospiraceae bacterium]|nr:hypothetical protein [Lachnospiraceae bacterium]
IDEESGELDEEEWQLALDNYEIATEEYNLYVDSSIVMRTQAQFDQLIHGIVTTINNRLCPDKEVTIAAGTTVTRNDGT